MIRPASELFDRFYRIPNDHFNSYFMNLVPTKEGVHPMNDEATTCPICGHANDHEAPYWALLTCRQRMECLCTFEAYTWALEAQRKLAEADERWTHQIASELRRDGIRG